ncbi:MAG: hypothetical protein HC937_02455 [Aquincola sp.]|nr:hypothetical protein [Aquincola sp.]
MTPDVASTMHELYLTTVDKYFYGTASNVGGIGVFEVAEEAERIHRAAFGDDFDRQPLVVWRNQPHLELAEGIGENFVDVQELGMAERDAGIGNGGDAVEVDDSTVNLPRRLGVELNVVVRHFAVREDLAQDLLIAIKRIERDQDIPTDERRNLESPFGIDS